MCRRLVCSRALLLVFVMLANTASIAQRLSDQARISLLTGTPGNELYSIFGHSAIRVYDPLLNLDLVYNYGTFDFNTPNFYLKFMRGKLDYMLSISEYKRFKVGYHYSGQSVTEQVLNLDSGSTQRVFEFLLDNYRPQNRFYKYDFFFDNCATRIRDLVEDLAGDSVVFDYPEKWISQPLSFRQLLDHHLVRDPWSDYGIDIALGLPADRPASPEDYMFLPEFMRIAFDKGRIMRDGDWKPLIKTSQQIIENESPQSRGFSITPTLVNWALFALIVALSVTAYLKGRIYKGLDYVLFGSLGMVGWLIVFLWFFTDHLATKDNLNILWALPWHVPVVFYILRRSSARAARLYFLVTGTLAVLPLILWPVSPQMFHVAVVPILLAIIVRSLLHILRPAKKHIAFRRVESV